MMTYHIFLQLRSPEKRKLATKEIEKIVRTLVEKKNEAQIKKLLEYFQNEFINSQQLNYRKGGLLAYSAIAIALIQEVKKYFSNGLYIQYSVGIYSIESSWKPGISYSELHEGIRG